MATIGSVLISVYAKTDGLRKSLKKAEKTISSFAKKAVKTLKNISIGLGVGAAAAVTGIIALVNKYSAEIDRLAKTSSKLGITVKALQKLEYQAELTGLEANKFNKAFNKMTTVIADADNGLSTAVRAFDKLGLNIEHIKSLSADEQFYAIAEAMKGINNQTEKLGLAKDIFGAGATGVLNTLNSNLQETSKEFESLGISVTQSGARMVEAYNDSKTKLSRVFSGFGLQLSAQLAAPFTKLIEWITNIVQEMGGMDKVAQAFAKAMINAIASIIEAGSHIFEFFRNIKLHLLEIKQTALNAADSILSLNAVEAGGKLFDKDFKFGFSSAVDIEIEALKKSLANGKSFVDKAKIKADELRALVGGVAGASPGTVKATNSPFSGGIQSPSSNFGAAANDPFAGGALVTQSEATARRIQELGEAAQKTTNAIEPKQKSKASSASFNGSWKQSLAFGGSSLSGFNTGSASSIANSSSAKQVVNNNSSTKFGQLNINMQTDAGEIAGDIFAEPKFIAGLKSFSRKQTNQAARQAAN